MFHHEVDLYYTQLGEGTTIVFCHGAGGNAASWFNQFGAFKDDYHCVAYDCRGFGRSVCSVDEFDGSKFGADAIALLDHLEVESAHFVCQSMGGWTGVQVALEYPERVEKLVLSDTVGGIALASGIASIRSLGERVADTRLAHAALAASYPEENPAGAFLYAQLGEFNQLPQSAVGGALFNEANLVSVERAQTLKLPILIFSGTDDVLWPPAVLQELAELLPTAERFEIDSGHSPYFENPEAFNRVLAEFLAR
jgi:pimeloyl-ACP methyl ester carboxylesterase